MVLNLKLVLIIISFVFVVNTQTFNPVFEIGVYPNHTKYGINAPTCGLSLLSVRNITFKPKCFKHNFPNQTIYQVNNRFEENADTQPKGRIFKGQDAWEDEAPWAVYLGYKPTPVNYQNYYSYLACTGSLITLEWVLIAAHCQHFEDSDAGRYSVVSGSKYYEQFIVGYYSGYHFRENTKWIIHPAYANPSSVTHIRDETHLENIKRLNDISLIKLNKPFPKRSKSGKYHVNPVCLPSRNRHQSRPLPFKATNFGYGLVQSWNRITNERPYRLQKAEYDINEDFGDFSGHYKGEHNTLEGEPKPCHGDSGSGIVYYMDEYKTKAVIVGTVHAGKDLSYWFDPRSDCRPSEDDYSLYIPTHSFIDWILDTIANN